MTSHAGGCPPLPAFRFSRSKRRSKASLAAAALRSPSSSYELDHLFDDCINVPDAATTPAEASASESAEPELAVLDPSLSADDQPQPAFEADEPYMSYESESEERSEAEQSAFEDDSSEDSEESDASSNRPAKRPRMQTIATTKPNQRQINCRERTTLRFLTPGQIEDAPVFLDDPRNAFNRVEPTDRHMSFLSRTQQTEFERHSCFPAGMRVNAARFTVSCRVDSSRAANDNAPVNQLTALEFAPLDDMLSDRLLHVPFRSIKYVELLCSALLCGLTCQVGAKWQRLRNQSAGKRSSLFTGLLRRAKKLATLSLLKLLARPYSSNQLTARAIPAF